MMRKKTLLQLPQLPVNANICKTVMDDIGVKERYCVAYKFTWFFRAVVVGDILKIAVYERTTAKKKNALPDCEIYIKKDEGKWLNYYPGEDKWGEAMINNINLRTTTSDHYGVKGYADSATQRIVNEYLGRNAKEGVRASVLAWQSGIRDNERMNRYRSELEQIDCVMELVPEPPKDFKDWMIKKAFKKHKYMFYTQDRQALCTACGRNMVLSGKVKHNQQGTCPSCRQQIVYKAWGKQKTVQDQLTLGIIQRLKDDSGYIYRRIASKIKYRRENGYQQEVTWWEFERYRMNNQFDQCEFFEFGEYKNTGIDRWCHYVNHGGYGWYYSKDSIIYDRNLDKMFENTFMKYMPVKKLLQKANPVALDPEYFLHQLARHLEYEKLIKVGLYRLVVNMTKERYEKLNLNTEAKKLWQYLRISKEYYKMAISKNVGTGELKVMQKATEYSLILSYEQIVFYKRYFANTCETIFRLGHPLKMYKYLSEVLEKNGTRMQDYLDYLEDLRVLELDRDSSLYFPKNFQAMHEEYAALRREHDKAVEAASIVKKNRMLRKKLKDLIPLFEMEDENMIIVFPQSKADFVKEGQNQHNCVGGYFERMVQGHTVVVFLRKKENLKKSYCTVEFAPDGTVRQNRTACNKDAPQEAKDFINKLSKQVAKRLEKRAREIQQKNLMSAV